MTKMRRFLIIVGMLVIAASGIAGGYIAYTRTTQEPPEPVSLVNIPDVFSRYAEQIRTADLLAQEQAHLLRDGSHVTLDDLHGFFDLPLKQPVVYQQIRAPGDPRAYRNGIHQGIDFYQTRRGDPIYAAAPGIIIRTDKDYQPMEPAFRDEMLSHCLHTWNGTPGSVNLPPVEEPYGDVLDKLRGRQVYIYHGQNAQHEPIISLYAHLSDVNHELAVYDLVDTETVIGAIGNSGTSDEMKGRLQAGNHLHIELFVGGMYWTPKEESEIGIKQANPRYAELQKMVLEELSRSSLPPEEVPLDRSRAETSP